MSIIESEDSYDEQLKSYNDKLSELETNISIVFNKLKNSYPNYKLYPNVSELENIFTNDKFNLNDTKQSVFLLEKKINTSNNQLKSIIDNKNEELKKIQNDNKKLNKKYQSMIDTDASSFGLKSQYSDQYNQNYISLILLSSFTLFFIIAAYKHTRSTDSLPIYPAIKPKYTK